MFGRRPQQLRLGTTLVLARIWTLFRQPAFIVISVIGHVWIVAGAYVFYRLEASANPHIENYLDALYWAVATVTTVGYGDVVPLTSLGKIVAMVFMVGGFLLFWCYTGLFASALIAPEFQEVEREVKEIEKEVRELEEEVRR